VVTTGKKLADSVIGAAWNGVTFNTDPIVSSVKQNFIDSVDQGIFTGNLSSIKGIFNLNALNAVRAAHQFSPIQIPANLK
jgi:hypothetical protein